MLSKIKRILRDPKSLTEQAMNASLWTVGASFVQHPLRLASNLILVQLLAPEAFGLMATVTVMHAGVNLFSDIGIKQSVMRSDKGEEPRFLQIVWTVQILRGFLLAGFIVAIALAVRAYGAEFAGPDTVYADPRLPDLLLVSALAVLCKGFQSTANLLARRLMRLGRLSLIGLTGQVLGIIAMVGLGYVIESVWALMAGILVTAVYQLIVSHTLMPGPKMRLAWDKEEASDLWSFGKWLILSSIGGFFAVQADRLVLGALIDKNLLGIYAIAVVWVQVGFRALRAIGTSIFIPSFSKILRERPKDIGRVLGRGFNAFILGSVVTFLGLALLGGELIDRLYPEIYQPAKDFVPLLAFKILFLPFLVLQQFIVTVGRTRDVAFLQIFRGAVTIALTYYCYVYLGLEAAIAAFALAPMTTAVIMAFHPEITSRLNRWMVLSVALGPGLIFLVYQAAFA